MAVKISIALATYNGSKYIGQQLASFAEQTLLPCELVVCDDGSTDGTVDLIRNFATSAKFPVHVHQNPQNIGFSNNFMKCASLCAGQWIAFSDQDDVWLPAKLARVSSLIEQKAGKGVVLVCHSADLVDENLSPTYRKLPKVGRDRVVKKNGHYGFLCIAGFTTTFKTDLLNEIDSSLRPRDYFAPGDKWQSHDKWIAMLANSLGSVAYISESLALYRRHSSALSGTYESQTAADRIIKSNAVGSPYYAFQRLAALDCAHSYRKISARVSNDQTRNDLMVGASKYEALAVVCGFRAKLYASNSLMSKLRMLLVLIGKNGYWGNRFFSLGLLSFFKDVVYGMGFLGSKRK